MEENKDSINYYSLVECSEHKPTLLDFLDIDEIEKQELLARDDEEWKKYWINMPEFIQEDNPPHRKIILNFRTEDDYQEFAKLIQQNLTDKTKSIWYPKLEKDDNFLKRWIECK